MPRPHRNLTDEKILQIIMEDIPSASASEGEDCDTGDTDFAKTGDAATGYAAVELSSSSDSDTEGPESNEDDRD